MERYQIQSAVRQLALTTSLMHGSPARLDERFYGDMIKDASVYLLFPPFPLRVGQIICVTALLPEQQMQRMSWHTIRLDSFQIKVPTVVPKGRIWKTNWICVDPVVICMFMAQFPENQHDTSCYTNIKYQYFFLFIYFLWTSALLGLCTIWLFPSYENEKLLIKPNRWAKYYHPFNLMAHLCQMYCLVSLTSD